MRLESYLAGSWQSGDGRATALRDASTGAVVAEAASGGLDFGAALEYARNVGGPALRGMTFHERAALLRALGKRAARLQARVLRAVARNRRDQRRFLDRHRRRDRHDARVREQGQAGTPEQPRLSRRSGGGAVEGRQFRGTAHLRAARRRRSAYQRLQLPRLGNAREARPCAACGRAGAGEARDGDQLPHRARRAAHRRDRSAAAGRAATGLWRRRRPVRSPRLPGRGVVHGLGGDGREASHP